MRVPAGDLTMEQLLSILIIDDNLNFLKAISGFIQEHLANQIQLLGAAQTGREGIRLAQKLHPQVILLDLKMPDMDGFEVIPLLRKVLPQVNIIATTLLSSEDFDRDRDIYCQECLQAGADSFIPKFRLENELEYMVIHGINPINHADGKLIDTRQP
jgi:DNA-binding NarL/FixJ family response regulator